MSGKTLAENVASVPPLSEGQDIVLPGGKVLKETGHIQILYGNIAEEGSVAKITGALSCAPLHRVFFTACSAAARCCVTLAFLRSDELLGFVLCRDWVW